MALTMVDQAVLIFGILVAVGLYTWLAADAHPKLRAYIKSNPGAPFIVAFIALLVAAAITYSYGMGGIANTLSVYAYFAVLIGVVLQAISLRWNKENESTN